MTARFWKEVHTPPAVWPRELVSPCTPHNAVFGVCKEKSAPNLSHFDEYGDEGLSVNNNDA